MQRTLSIIKPDAIERKIVGNIIQYLEKGELKIIAINHTTLTIKQAEIFYHEHIGKSFFTDLMVYITSGPIIIQVLEGINAIEQNRLIMGATDPKQADKGTIRGDLATNISANLVHGSDSDISAQKEINLFFSGISMS